MFSLYRKTDTVLCHRCLQIVSVANQWVKLDLLLSISNIWKKENS